MTRTRITTRLHCRRRSRLPWRSLNRTYFRSLPGFERRPDYVRQAIGAFRRAIRAHRRLARLAPSYFDSAVVDRERREREAQRRWMASWEPALEKVYGPASAAKRQVDELADRPRKLHPRTERAMERELANWHLWFAAGRLALKRHRQCRPHALLSFGQIASLLDMAFKLARLACGLDSPQSAAEITWDDTQWKADLLRAYGPRPLSPGSHHVQPPAASACSDPDVLSPAPVTRPDPPTKPSSAVHEKPDLTPHAIVVGPHGLLCLKRIDPC